MNLKNVTETIIVLAIIAAFLRGLFVFDTSSSAANSYPVASAICFIGSIFAAIQMLKFKSDKQNR